MWLLRLGWKWPYSFHLVLLECLLHVGSQLLTTHRLPCWRGHVWTLLLANREHQLPPLWWAILHVQPSQTCGWLQPQYTSDCNYMLRTKWELPSWVLQNFWPWDCWTYSNGNQNEDWFVDLQEICVWILQTEYSGTALGKLKKKKKSMCWLILANCPNNCGTFFSFQIKKSAPCLQTVYKTQTNYLSLQNPFSHILFYQKSHWVQKYFLKTYRFEI